MPNKEAIRQYLQNHNELLTASEISGILRVVPGTVHNLIRDGELPGFKVGSSYRVLKDDLIEYMSKQPDD